MCPSSGCIATVWEVEAACAVFILYTQAITNIIWLCSSTSVAFKQGNWFLVSAATSIWRLVLKTPLQPGGHCRCWGGTAAGWACGGRHFGYRFLLPERWRFWQWFTRVPHSKADFSYCSFVSVANEIKKIFSKSSLCGKGDESILFCH